MVNRVRPVQSLLMLVVIMPNVAMRPPVMPNFPTRLCLLRLFGAGD